MNSKEKQNFNKEFLEILQLENKEYYITTIKNYLLAKYKSTYYIYEKDPLFNYINTPIINRRKYNNMNNYLCKCLSTNALNHIIRSQIINKDIYFNYYDKGICINNIII